jgi:hypothetical protein
MSVNNTCYQYQSLVTGIMVMPVTNMELKNKKNK